MKNAFNKAKVSLNIFKMIKPNVNQKGSALDMLINKISQDVRPEVPHHPWRVITEKQGLQDAGPLSMMDN